VSLEFVLLDGVKATLEQEHNPVGANIDNNDGAAAGKKWSPLPFFVFHFHYE